VRPIFIGSGTHRHVQGTLYLSAGHHRSIGDPPIWDCFGALWSILGSTLEHTWQHSGAYLAALGTTLGSPPKHTRDPRLNERRPCPRYGELGIGRGHHLSCDGDPPALESKPHQSLAMNPAMMQDMQKGARQTNRLPNVRHKHVRKPLKTRPKFPENQRRY
jgi:hypothetical protein